MVCIVDLTGIPQSDVTDYLWLSILLQTLELPIGIICCCVPNLKPAAAEISNAFSPVASRIFCCFRRIRSSEDRLNGQISYQASEHEPKAPFVRLDDRPHRAELGCFPGDVSDTERDIELGFNQGKPMST